MPILIDKKVDPVTSADTSPNVAASSPDPLTQTLSGAPDAEMAGLGIDAGV